MLFFSYSSHLLLHYHTPWLHPARAPTVVPTTAAAAAAARQAVTNSAKQTSTFVVCPRQPQIMTWSNSVSREYHAPIVR